MLNTMHFKILTFFLTVKFCHFLRRFDVLKVRKGEREGE